MSKESYTFVVKQRSGRQFGILIDLEDKELVEQYTWHVNRPDDAGAHIVTRLPRSEDPSDRKVYLHRLVVDAPTGVVVDHINQNRLDNRKSNLRFCSIKENVRNQKVHVGRRFKGVSHSRHHWRAYITVDYKAKHLGVFATQEEAARAYDRAAMQMHGAFACLNFPT